MRRMPGSVSARGFLAAAVVGAAAMAAGCGAQHAGNSAGGTPQAGQSTSVSTVPQCTATPSVPTRSLTVSTKNSGQVLCVKQGTTVAVFLQGTAARRWSPIQATNTALQPRADGRLMLKLGVTGAVYQAARPGVSTITSSLASCPGPQGASTGSPGPGCKMGMVFHLTLVVTQ